MDKNYKPITSMKKVLEQLRKLRRQYLRYQQAEIIYSISHKKLFELASDAGALYRIDGTVLIKTLIIEYLKQYSKANRKEINKLLWDKLPDSLSDDQKKHKVHNLLTALKNKNIIEKDGENQRKANWILKD